MTLADATATLICLPLFVAIIRLGYAQNSVNNTEIGGSSGSRCREDQFQCRIQQCIDSQLLCDGTADCWDSSDETVYQCSRPELNCPSYAFRCTYGACIDFELWCDGKTDCSADGSDENGCRIPSNAFNGSASEPAIADCLGPPLPINGIYEIRQTRNIKAFENVDPEGYSGLVFTRDSLLVYSCNRGYKIRGNSDVRCSIYGRWSRKPVCIEIRCSPLSSTSMIANCTHASGIEEPCSAVIPVAPKTRAQVSCRPGYTKATEFAASSLSENVECNEDGKWVPEPIRCVPVCGRANPGQKSLTADGTATNISTFPWHASIYVPGNSSDGKKVFRCGATVIQPNLLLTAARCLYDLTTSSDGTSNSDMNPSDFLERLFIITGNIHHDYDSPLHDPQFVRKHRVRNVHTDCSFLVSLPEEYSDDIALAELEEPLQFTSNLLPACLDMTGSIQQSLEAGASGRLPDSEKLPTAWSSQMLQPATVASMSDVQCTILFNATHSPFNIKGNRFCDELNNNGMISPQLYVDDDIVTITNTTKATGLCANAQFNDGSGLMYEVDNRWYVMGFISRDTSVFTEGSRTSCNGNVQLLYTKVSKYTRWIQQVTSDLERFKYPPCSRYLAPFGTTTTTPATISQLMTTTSASIANLTSTTLASTSTTTSASIANLTGTTLASISTTTSASIVKLTGTTLASTSTTESTKVRVLPSITGSSCVALPPPINGERKIHRDFCEGDLDCDISETIVFGPGSLLVYSCYPGYRLEGNTDVYCRADGIWSSNPFCTEITCRPLETVSTIATCSRLGKDVDCYFPVSPNTEAKVTCRSGYWAAPVQDEIVKCNSNGTWEPEPSMCIPACGEALHLYRPRAGVEIAADAYDFPWRGSIYVKKKVATGTRKNFQCGATLIQANLLLTAARCVYDDRTGESKEPKQLSILMSNIHRQYDSHFHDPHSVRRGTVKNVYIHCGYKGSMNNYLSDIALLELQEPFEFFNIQLPFACLDFSGYIEANLGLHPSGRLLGFGRTTTGVPSCVLQTITVPYVSQAQCGVAENDNVTSSDKFCAGYNNGTAACVADGGSGLYREVNGLWYVMGIASVDPYADLNGEHACRGDTHMLYTRISDYMKWILDVIFHLEHYKSYPPCIRVIYNNTNL